MASSLPQQQIAAAAKAQAQADRTAADAIAESGSVQGFATNGAGAAFGNPNIGKQGIAAGATQDIGTFDPGTGTGWDTSEDAGATPPPTNTQVEEYTSVTPYPNPLSDYPSYTYNLSLHILSADDFNTMVDTPDNFTITKNLISEANRYSSIRDSNFTDDFYFENLKMTTLIVPNTETRSSNAIEINFTIIEPYGMTLLNRILDINNTELTGTNYLDMPYLLEISFYGMDNDGNPTLISEQSKWIPIKITNFKIKASVKGAEYAVQAVPFNYQANFTTAQAIKANFTVTAKTVGEYLDNSELSADQIIDIISAQNLTSDANRQSTTQQTSTGTRYVGNGGRGTSQVSALSPADVNPLTTKSFTSAYNYWNLREAQHGNMDYADQITFIIDEAISKSSIVDPKKNNADNAPSTTAKDSTKTGPDLTTSVFSLNAGTQILSIIDMVMQNSDYILSQLNDPSIQNKNKNTKVASAQQLSDLKQGKPVNWYRVVPSVKLAKFDKTRNKWGKTITYYIQPYTYHNSRHPAAPVTTPPGAVKDYQYIYTGHNTEVIGFDIDFNALYFTALQVNKGNTTALNISAKDDEGKDNGKSEIQHSDIQPNQYELISGDHKTIIGGSETRSVAQNAGNVIQSFYTSAAGDMINLKLQILGDPEFIKQDDIFYNPGFLKLTYKNQYLPGNGSIAMDNGEIFCNVTFKSPVDIDENTGLLRTDSKYTVSYFSGYYKVIKIDSEFRSGKFTQTLELIRYPNQPNSGQVSKGWDMQSDDTSRNHNDTTKTDNPAVAGSGVETAPVPVTPSQDTTPTNDDNVSEVERQSVIDQYDQVPAEDTSMGAQQLRNIAQSGTTVSIGENANPDGSVIV